MKDKYIEKSRYDLAAKKWSEESLPPIFGSEAEIIYFNSPYIFYEKYIQKIVLPKKEVLEIGSGSGKYTYPLLDTGAYVTATDISQMSLKLLSKRLEKSRYYKNLKTKVVDMESIPFDDNTFDVISIAGSLSYGRSELVDKEIYRVLRPNGYFICVDSLNFNPIYRTNRYINYLRGLRSLMTLKNMPTIKRVSAYSNLYSQVTLKYFGCISFLSPLISIIFDEYKTKKITDKFDSLFANPYCAFKFVLIAKK
tara:strand:+ start:228 stop:983 length:756 start_codon:yes stop_codon:yes gene_type:complete